MRISSRWFGLAPVVLALVLPQACRSDDAQAPVDPVLGDLPLVNLPPSGSWAAASKTDPDTYVAVVIDGSDLLGYVCDGKTRSRWFRSSLTSLPAVVLAPIDAETHAAMTLSLVGEGDAKELHGSVAFGEDDPKPLLFELPRVEGAPVLYRASQGVAERSVLGGWIVLPDGTQRGLATLSSGTTTTTVSPTLDPVAGTITYPSCEPDTATATDLEPQPCTSMDCLATPTLPMDSRPQFNVVTLGDSFAAGEGAPATCGSGCPQVGGLSNPNCATPAVWDDPAVDPGAQFCHRTPNSGSAQAVELLRTEFPDIHIQFKSFACTGAVIRELHDSDQSDCPITQPLTAGMTAAKQEACQKIQDHFGKSSPINKAWPLDAPNAARRLPPQLEQLRSFLEGRDCGTEGSAGCWASVDALVMNIGGNDARFSEMLKNLIYGNIGCDVEVKEEVEAQIALLGGKFKNLDTAIRSMVDAQCRRLAPSGKDVLLLEVPSLFTSKASGSVKLCTDGEFNDAEPDTVAGSEGNYNYMGDIRECEADVVENQLIPKVRAAYDAATEDASWSYVTGIFDRSRGHGVCVAPASGDAAGPYLNTNFAARQCQGNDLLAAPTLTYSDDLSMGIVHPNAKGYRMMYRDPIANTLRERIKAKYLPLAPALPAVTALSRSVDAVKSRTTLTATLTWLDRSSIESGQTVRVLAGQEFQSPAAANATSATVSWSVPGTGTSEASVSVEACSVAKLCGASTAITVTDAVPTGKPQVNSVVRTAATTATSPGALQIQWLTVPGAATAFYEVRFSSTLNKTGIVVKAPAKKPNGLPNGSLVVSGATFTSVPTKGTATVRACNFTGCGPLSSSFGYAL